MRDMATMREAPELGIPEIKPAIESIRGRWAFKVSPRRRHSILQGRLWGVLAQWAGDRGEVGTEWRCYLLPSGEKPSSLVPDVAFISFERMPVELGELREKPTIAPDVAVEIFSPDDRRSLLDVKIALYLQNGSNLIVIVDPEKHSIEMHERQGSTTFVEPQMAICAAYPDLSIDSTALFSKL
jgi:Uma2 family endonuclease